MKPTPCPKCGAAVFIIEDNGDGVAIVLDAKPIKTLLQVGEHVATGTPVYPDHRVTCGRRP